jgi:hypothetical protein
MLEVVKILLLNFVLYRCSLQGFSFTCVWEIAFIRYFKLKLFFSAVLGCMLYGKTKDS